MLNHRVIGRLFFKVIAVIALVINGSFHNKVDASSVGIDNQLSLYPNIETVGIALSGDSLPAIAGLMYRQSGATAWHNGHPLVKIRDGRLVGSLFGLSPSTQYDVRVIVGAVEFSGSTTTQPDELQFTPSLVLYVNAHAPSGGNGTAAAPFRSIQEGVNHAIPGTRVLVADGFYQETVNFPVSGNANQWIQVKAEGSQAVLDGSQTLSGNIWTPHPARAHVWFTKIGTSLGYLARDGKHFYKYDDLNGLMQSRGHGKVTIKEGWYFDPDNYRLYVRSQDDPSRHNWQAPRLNHAFDVNGRDWIWIEGFEMQFYGISTDGCGVCTLNASHLVIRKNKIHNLRLGIFINWNGNEAQGNDTRIEYNEIYDPFVNEFPWLAAKGSTLEGTAVIVRGHIGAIVRQNEIHNFFNGIYTGSSATDVLRNPAVAFDADIYENHIHDISDDALEPEGACVNHRFRNNVIDSTFVGVSLAPITVGPTWVLRSLITNYKSRSIKWASNSDGIVLIYHNTSWTKARNVNAMDLITPVRNSTIYNNIFQSTGYAFAEVPKGSVANDWNNNNWYTTQGLWGPRFKWENVSYYSLAKLCAAKGLECRGYETTPGFTNPGSGEYTLLPSSPNIDRGVFIPGINDGFLGGAPDVGAYEFAKDTSGKLPNLP